ncbi:protein lifeguard 4-like [Gigantopelta aegis]|uniref:protein lifeguard 4-like n=1 Tax=Gigantopelta aegis TaxID=1735272 RepID=UPI001B88B44C|nr:protein lifeguard 4-like [Gigantopelta aegis]
MAATMTLDGSGSKMEGKSSIVDDFMYGSNVATAHVYIRMGFLRKVYGILTAQILLTTIVAALFIVSEPIKHYVQNSGWMMMTALFGTFGVLLALMWKRNETPTNYILLAVFTLMEAYSVGVVVTFYNVSAVIEAFVLTLGVTLALTVYTLQSKRDFSSWGAGLFSLLWILILAGMLQLFFPSVLMDKAIAIGGAALFSMFIIFDTHMMMHKLSPEEYILASINLYLDILNLFLHILRALGDRK